MEAGELEGMGPIDYVLIEWPDDPPSGEAAPIVFDLVERGIIRVLDFAIFAKNEDGDVAAIDFGELPEHAAALEDFGGASSGILGEDDIAEAAAAITARCARRPDRLREHLGRPVRDRRPPIRRAARQLRADPGPGLPGGARRRRSRLSRPHVPRKDRTDARIDQRSRADRSHRRHRNRSQQPGLAPSGRPLGRAGPGGLRPAGPAPAGPRPLRRPTRSPSSRSSASSATAASSPTRSSRPRRPRSSAAEARAMPAGAG